ncbi:universal stress protein [Streptomyces sp. NPDC086787]|uniref:universal stress protein n=1 Tax=Streptomyces sp. NPDC086787 TaxID=3365759 RepID=UPI0038099D71
MIRTVTVGVDGSPESRAAAGWAAREAQLRRLPLRAVHVWEPIPALVAQAPQLGGETLQSWTDGMTVNVVDALRLRHPDVEIIVDQLPGEPAEALLVAAESAELLVLGSRGFGGIGGLLLGSVSLSAVAGAGCPVVLVRAGEHPAEEDQADAPSAPAETGPCRPVVLGLDAPDEALLEFAFDAAARRDASLRVASAWSEPPSSSFYRYYGSTELYDSLTHSKAKALTEVLLPWRQKFPTVQVVEASRCGVAAQILVDSSRQASLVVVGRRIRTNPFGTHIGHVTHAVLHHSTPPVAVVPHP